jgi:transposase
MAFWEGHVVQSVHARADVALLIDLPEDPSKPARRGQCGRPRVLVHDWCWHRIRERDWLDRRVWLNLPVRLKAWHHREARVT